MLNFLFGDKPSQDFEVSTDSSKDDEILSHEQDMSLKYTSIAIDLIEGKGGIIYRSGMKRMFSKPSIMSMVAPEYRKQLKEIVVDKSRENSK
jgi:hypothetical protein